MNTNASVENKDIQDKAQSYLRDWYYSEMPTAYVYHTYHFAQETVASVQKVAEKSEIEVDDESFEVLTLAAWFHYTGMSESVDDFHQHSARIAEDFLQENSYSPEQIEKVKSLILSTASDDEPEGALEQIYHDGINLIFGRKSFFKKAELMRLEEEHIRNETYLEKDWSERLIEMLVNVHFYTPYARNKYGKRKLEHLAKQKNNNTKAERTTLKKLTGKDMGRGIDTLYRTGFRNHINLSRIADGKANMMISINTIVLSILLAISGAGLSYVENFFYDSPGFALPIIILLLSSLTALVFAVFSAKPSVTEYDIDNIDPHSSETNMLYFGNFLQLDKEKFVDYMNTLKVDQDQLYSDLSRDLYNLGLVLRKKYRLLTISYNVFVGGLVLSVMVFLIIYIVLA